MSNCYPVFDSHANFSSYSYSCRIPRRGAGAVRSNGEKVQVKDTDEPYNCKNRRQRFTKLLPSCRLQDANRNTHLSNQLVV